MLHEDGDRNWNGGEGRRCSLGENDGTMVKKRMKLRPVDVETLFTIICRALRRRVVVAVDDRASQPLVGLV